MSESPAVSAEDVQQNLSAICCLVSSTTLLVFENLVTFDREYRLVWKRRFSAATLFFLLTRYTVLLQLLFDLPSINPLSTKSCSVTAWLDAVFELLTPVLLAAFSSLRAYALSGRQWQLASLIFLLMLVPFGTDLFEVIKQVPMEAPPPLNCISVSPVSPQLQNILHYVARSAVMVADVLVLTVTVHQTYRTRKIAMEANLKTSFSSLVLRDGTLYFLILLIINIADIIATATQQFLDISAYFVDPMTAILISRFILNLREIDSPANNDADASRPSFLRSQEHSLQFTNFIEPLGAPLDHEFSFSVQEPCQSYEEQADREIEHRGTLGNNEDTVSSWTDARRPSDAAGRSQIEEDTRSAMSI